MPLTYNFVDAQVLKFEEMGKAIAGRKMIELEEAAGRGKWVSLAKDPPKTDALEPWVKVGDGKTPAFNMYAGPDSREVIGHYYAPPDVAAVWKNHLAPGLKGNPLFAALMIPGRMATQLLLGVSGFHATTIATESLFSEMAIGVESLAHGELADAARAFGRSPTSPLAGLEKALAIKGEYLRKGAAPEHAAVLDAMIKGGYRFTHTSEFLQGDRVQAFKKAFGEAIHGETVLKKVWGASKAIPDAITAAVEQAAVPVLGKYVPLQKLYATYMRVAEEMKRLPVGATDEVVRARMGDVVDEMDYRFGQVTYDNHFVNRSAKDIAQLVLLAPGWTFGTLAEVARAPLRAKSAAYWVSAFTGTAMINGVLTYALMPEGKDYLAFRDGTKDADGNDNRHVLPGYIMKDVYSWTHHPVQTAGHKLSPGIAWSYYMLTNQTYNGDQVYNPDDSWERIALDLGRQTAQEVVPLSIQNFLEASRRGEKGPGEVARATMGVTPAKREFVRTPAQNALADIIRRHRPQQTPEEQEGARVRAAIRETVKTKGREAAVEEIRAQLAAGKLTEKQVVNLLTPSTDPGLVRRFKSLSLDDAEVVFKKAKDYEGGPQERTLLEPVIEGKRARSGRVLFPNYERR